MIAALSSPRPLRILAKSASDATLALLKTMLQKFHVKAVPSFDDAWHYLQAYSKVGSPLDFIILDDQSGANADNLAQQLQASEIPQFKETKVIHLYTPTSAFGQAVFANSSIAGVIKVTKPPRLARLLQTLAISKDLLLTIATHQCPGVSRQAEEQATLQRTVYGNVLIAEGEPYSSLYHVY